MDGDTLWVFVVGVAVLAVALTLAVTTGLVPFPQDDTHDRATVRVFDGDRLVATVDAEVADTTSERYDGLSGTDPLPNGSGMLFVHDVAEEHTYVMRGMNYGLDIVFVGADGRVTKVTHAPPPGPGENGNSIRRTGRGKWVLEVPRGFANATGIDQGDRVEIEYPDE